MKKIFLFLGTFFLVGVVIFLMHHFSRRIDQGVLAVSGNVEATEVDIGFKSAGRIVELFAEEGQRVNKGDKIATLDSAELESHVSQSRAYLSETMARLQELRTGSRPQEVEQARAECSRAEAELSKAKKDLDRAEVLFKNGAISAQKMDASQEVYNVSFSRHQKALESLSLVKEGPRKEEIRVAANRVKQAASALRGSEERVKDTVIYAPLSGVVMRRNVEQGEIVSPGTPVYTVGDLANPWIKVYVKEDRLGLVKLGQKARISVDSYPGKVYEGNITYISSEAEFTPKNVQTQEERVKLVFGVKVSVRNIDDELKPSMPADVKIVLK